MNVQAALKILKLRAGMIVEYIEDNRYYFNIGGMESYSPRELISLARSYTSDCRSSTAIRKNIKKYDKKDRLAIKQAIVHKEYDKIPLKDKLKPENPYNWW